MKKIIQFLALSLLMSAGVVAFFAFVTWGEHPATWSGEARFFIALVFVLFGIAAPLVIVSDFK